MPTFESREGSPLVAEQVVCQVESLIVRWLELPIQLTTANDFLLCAGIFFFTQIRDPHLDAAEYVCAVRRNLERRETARLVTTLRAFQRHTF